MIVPVLRAVFGAALLAMLIAGRPAAAQDIAAIDPNADVTAPLGWRVAGVTGEASARQGAAPFKPLSVGDIVAVGSEIRTERGGVVFLSRRGDRIVIQPESELRIAEPKAGGLLTQFFQALGQVFYDVEPRSSRSFGVQGPYMVAVVKGTRFLVTVDRAANSVRVDEGRVLVASADGTSSALVGAGNVATVEESGIGGVQLSSSMIPLLPALLPSPQTLASPVASVGTPAAGATNGVSGTSGTVGGVGGGVASKTGGVVDGVAGAAGSVVGGTANAAGGAVAGVGDAVGGVVGGTAGDAVAGLGDAAGDTVSGLGDAVGGAVGGLGNAAGGLLGGRR